MTPIEQQLACVVQEFSGAASTKLPDGSYAITIPNWPLPPGWNAPSTCVRFIVPVGYPMSRPDCFWADAGLRLINGGMPKNSGANPMPGEANPQLWFSWHVDRWSPNHDTLLTYIRVIQARLNQPQ